jgi:Mg2+/Co2+ transporter CorB
MLTLANEGNKRAKLVNRLWDRKDLLISAILTGNNIANIASSSLAAGLMLEMFGEIGLAYATAGMTILIVLFVEILPKTIALRAPDETALTLSPFMRVVMFVLEPVTLLCRAIVNTILNLFKRRKRGGEEEEAAEQEIRGMIDMHATFIDESHDTAYMLHAIVDLAGMTVADVMTHRRDMVSVSLNQPPEIMVQQALEARHARVPVWGKSSEDIVGVIDTRRLLAELVRRGGSTNNIDTSSFMSPPWFIPDTSPLLDQLKAFRGRGTNNAYVIDEYGVLLGMITLADILEEIVGHYDRGQFNALSVPKPQADGSFILDGRFPIRELNREMGWELNDEAATTVAGYVINLAERIPEAGETVTNSDGFSFQVLSRKQKRIAKVRIRYKPAKPASKPPA